ncbi:MAG: TonB-dependent receptor, partial [bacterium]|nr:TonB-dependent receptor [bacterium]
SFKQGNRIVEIKDYGLEAGGPLVKDRMWFWGSYGMQKPHLLTILDLSDRTELETYSGKVNAQVSTANSAVAFYLRGNKIKIGRNASPTRMQPSSWNQSGPTDVYKLEDTQVFGSSLYLTGMVSHVGGGFQLTPQGGFPDGAPTTLDDNFIWQSNYVHYETERPQDQLKLDGSYFFNTGSVNNELKYGVGYRTAEVNSLTAWPQNQLNLNFADSVAYIRDLQAKADLTYGSLYLQDTMTFSNLTLNVGLRYDKQDGNMIEATAAGVPGFEEAIPDLGYTNPLPTATFAGGDDGFEWTSITPRVGLTWALGEERKTLLRAGFSQFADQLAHWNGPLHAWPLVSAYSYFYYTDLNGDGSAQPNEVTAFDYDLGHDPLGQTSPNRIDSNYDPGMTDELLVSIEHSILPELVVGFNVTWRNLYDIADRERLVQDCVGGVCGAERVHQRSDYELAGHLTGTLPDGTAYSVPYYGLRDGVEETQGFLLETGDREQDYLGFALTVNKRLSKRWMLRGNFSWSSWEWDIPESDQEDPNDLLGGGSIDGDQVLFGSGLGSGPKGSVYINSNWSYSLTGMYQVVPEKPWAFNVSASLNGREGYPIPYYERADLPGITGIQFGGATAINLVEPEDYRCDDVMMLDMRVEKEFNLKSFNLTASIDGFNLFNDSTVLQRQHRLGTDISDHVLEVVSARVFRAGLRFSFN